MLKHIVLTNFQVFRERTVIPLADISLLVGPNSAGKSAIIDALLLVDLIVGTGEEDYREMRSAAKRWRSKLAVDSSTTTVELGIQIGARDSPDPIFSEIYSRLSAKMEGSADVPAFKLDDEWEGEATLVIEIGKNDIESMTILTDGKRALSYTSAKEYDTLELYSAAMPEFLGSVCDIYGYDPDHTEAFRVPAWFIGGKFSHNFISKGEDDGDYERMLILIANGILTSVKENFKLPTTVAGDRGLIESYPEIYENPTSFRVATANLWVGPNSGGSPESKRHSDPALQELCYSALEQSARLASGSAGLDPLEDDSDGSFRPLGIVLAAIAGMTYNSKISRVSEPIHDFVNRHLRDSLFIDRGYQIAYEMCPVLPSSEARQELPENRYWRNSSGEPGENSGRGPFVFGAVVNPHLIDQQGARHAFSDVGTGISCVIPVLAAIHGPQSFIQQPELHLHPALQSALGDVLTDRLATGPCQHFIETHSEHLLLRLLRRVRETHAGKHPAASPLALTPQQLSILYFDPQPDGSTQVRQIRVSRDGDFIDRWPRGFFEERRRELFDE